MRSRRPTTIGVPYGGLVYNGRIKLPNGQNHPYPQPDGGNTWLVRHPAAPGAARTAEQAADDAARGFVWRDHAIIAGRTKMVHGQPLGAIGNRNWLYCDAAGCTWVVGAYIYRPGDKPTHLRIDVWLYKRFGFFGSGEASAIDRLLATRDFIPTWDDQVESVWGGLLTPPQSIFGYQGNSQAVQPIPNEDGSRALVCVMGSGGENDQDIFINIAGSWRFLSDVFEVQIAGAGAGLRDVAGAGISAAIAHTHTASDLIEQAYFDNRVSDPELFEYQEVPCTAEDGVFVQRYIATPKNTRYEQSSRLKVLPFWSGGLVAWVETSNRNVIERNVSLSISGESTKPCVDGRPFGAPISDTTTVQVSATYYSLDEKTTYVGGNPVGGYRLEATDENTGSGGGFEATPGIIYDALSFYVGPDDYIGVHIPFPGRGDPKLTTNNLLTFEGRVIGDESVFDYHAVSLGEHSQTRLFARLATLPSGLTAHPETGEIAFGCWV